MVKASNVRNVEERAKVSFALKPLQLYKIIRNQANTVRVVTERILNKLKTTRTLRSIRHMGK